MPTTAKKKEKLNLKELARLQKKNEKLENEWYTLRHMFSFANWAYFYILLGGREAGKSYSVTDFFCRQYKYKHIPFIWIRLTDTQAGKLLQNNAMKLVDPDLRRKYGLDLVTNANIVYNVTERSKPNKEGKTKILKKEVFARVYDLSTAYNDKGSLFDKDFLNDPNMRYNIALDEFEREQGERVTFDIMYNLVCQLENNVRSTKDRIKIFFLGNCLEDASDVLASFNFIPEKFGIYKLCRNKKILIQYLKERREHPERIALIDRKYEKYDFGKRCVIEYIEPSEAYKNRRHGTIADILAPTSSNFTNKIDIDNTLIDKSALRKPLAIIKFTKDKSKWFTIWNSNIIKGYHGEPCKKVIAMRMYLDEPFNQEEMSNVFAIFNSRSYRFHNLIDFKKFQTELSLLKSK